MQNKGESAICRYVLIPQEDVPKLRAKIRQGAQGKGPKVFIRLAQCGMREVEECFRLNDGLYVHAIGITQSLKADETNLYYEVLQ